MYVRLAFAVAAHLEPEILLVDEVLAVGDSAFQKKCLGKMDEVAKQGRTVLFVSHNMPAVINLCSRAILLDKGEVAGDGPSRDIVNQYVELSTSASGEVQWTDAKMAPGNSKVRLRAVRVVSEGEKTSNPNIDNPITIEVEYENFLEGQQLAVSIHLLDNMETAVLASSNMHSANLDHDPWFDQPHPMGVFKSSCTLPAHFLNDGRYSINAIVLSNVTHIEVSQRLALTFNTHDSGAMRREYTGHWLGVVRPKLKWRTIHLQDDLMLKGTTIE